MDFFREQDRAKAKTAYLVFLFFSSIFITVTLLWFCTSLALNYFGYTLQENWGILSYSIFLIGFSSFILICSFIKVITLSIGGGHAIAKSLGGYPVKDEKNFKEKQLLNVVAEMSIAAGIPIPQVFIIPEKGINAFAAGTKFDNAVIGVSQGAIELLNRNELQGVIAHEISHILNGDMKTNIKLSGIVFGLISITTIGKFLLYSTMRRGYYRVRFSNSKKDINVLPIIGFILVIIGSVGVFISNLIKSAISRQREFLADASAVQFTRDKNGIGNALKKIFSFHLGSSINHYNATNHNHLFLGEASPSLFGVLASTHPPLKKRILAIDSKWNGEKINLENSSQSTPIDKNKTTTNKEKTNKAILFSLIGNIKPSTINSNLSHISNKLLDLAYSKVYAPSLVLSLVLDNSNKKIYDKQMNEIKSYSQESFTILQHNINEIIQLNNKDKFSLFQICLYKLKLLNNEEKNILLNKCKNFIQADNKISLFEWVLTKILESIFIKDEKNENNKPAIAIHTFLQTLAQQSNTKEEEKIYIKACQEISLKPSKFQKYDLKELGLCLKVLKNMNIKAKKQILKASCFIVSYDSIINEEEFLLLQAFCHILEIPMPCL